MRERPCLRRTVCGDSAAAPALNAGDRSRHARRAVCTADRRQDAAGARELAGISVREHRWYVAGPTGVSTAKPAEPKKIAPTTKAAKEAPQDDHSDARTAAGSTGVVGGQPVAGPVRLGTGGTLTLIKKVTPIYPPVMQSARIAGLVVLDAIIHSDGTIGDVTVLRSTNDAFTRAAIDAVKQWRYTALPYEGIVTVTVNFTLT